MPHPAGVVFHYGGVGEERVPVRATLAVATGWVVAPRRWVPAVRAEHEIQLLPPALNQLALVQLMQSGAYDRRLRAARQRYRARRNVLIDALRLRLPEYRVRGAEAGMQLLLELPPGR
jgi:GntR family transcriptional regulator / MocR family aminotransferase